MFTDMLALSNNGDGGNKLQYLIQDGVFQDGLTMSPSTIKPDGWGGTVQAPTISQDTGSIHIQQSAGKQGSYNTDSPVDLSGKNFLIITLKGTVASGNMSDIGLNSELSAFTPIVDINSLATWYSLVINLSQYQGKYYIMMGINISSNLYIKDMILV